MKRGDIYLVALDPTEGPEQRGLRPVLIVSPADFNEATKLPVVLPITSGGAFARSIGFAVPLSGIKTAGHVRCDQPRVLDLQARIGRKVDTLPPAIMAEVLARLAPIFERGALFGRPRGCRRSTPRASRRRTLCEKRVASPPNRAKLARPSPK